MRVILTAGGTGGHIYPALSVAEAISSRGGAEVRYVGTADGLESKLVPAAGLPFMAIESKPLSRRFSFSILKTISAFRSGCAQARKILDEFKPDVVVGFGGYVAGPMVYTAAKAGVRTLIHEQNAMPGRANRLLSRWVDTVALNFEDAAAFFPRRKVVVVGMPARADFGRMSREEGRQRMGLDPAKPVVLVYGGSRGAQSLNKAMLAAAPELVARGLQILHQTGTININSVKEQADRMALDSYRVVPYIEDAPAAFAAADLAICRSGASTIAELTACGLPAILVPYPFAIADHQTFNARALSGRGAAVLVPDAELTGERLVSEVDLLIGDSDRLRKMSEATRALSHPDAAEKMAGLILGS